MARQRAKTAARGYSGQHQKVRAQLIAAFVPGQPCAICGAPMWNPELTDLGHTPDRTGYIGLCDRSCNRADGNRSPRRKQRRASYGWRTSRDW